MMYPMKYVLFIILLHVPILTMQGQDEEPTSFRLRIRDLGLDSPSNDLSGDGVIAFPEPSCAYVNIIGATHMPAYKGDTTSASACCWMPRATPP